MPQRKDNPLSAFHICSLQSPTRLDYLLYGERLRYLSSYNGLQAIYGHAACGSRYNLPLPSKAYAPTVRSLLPDVLVRIDKYWNKILAPFNQYFQGAVEKGSNRGLPLSPSLLNKHSSLFPRINIPWVARSCLLSYL